jgi:hypothetical protein
MQGISILFFLDFLDQPGINIPEWPTHQDINVHFFYELLTAGYA